jgi:hypothetical protein
MMEQFTTPTGPPADQKKDRSTLYKWVGAGAALFVVAAIFASGDTDQPATVAPPRVESPATTVQAATTTTDPVDIEETIQLLAINQVLDNNEEEICRLVRELVLKDGLELDFVVDVALAMFMEGFDGELLAKPQSVFRTRMRSCI